MGKWTNDLMMDASLDWVINNAAQELVCDGQPTDRADALARALASVAVAPGDFTKADGVVDGRRFVIAAKNAVSVTASGEANHVVLISGSLLMEVTTCVPATLTAGGTVNIPQWSDEIGDPA